MKKKPDLQDSNETTVLSCDFHVCDEWPILIVCFYLHKWWTWLCDSWEWIAPHMRFWCCCNARCGWNARWKRWLICVCVWIEEVRLHHTISCWIRTIREFGNLRLKEILIICWRFGCCSCQRRKTNRSSQRSWNVISIPWIWDRCCWSTYSIWTCKCNRFLRIFGAEWRNNISLRCFRSILVQIKFK